MVETVSPSSHHAPPNWLVRVGAAALILAALFGAKALLNNTYNAYITQVIALVGVNIILAVSLNLINGVTGQFSLGHAGFMAAGAYASAAFSFYASPYLALPQALIFAIALVIGAVVAGVAGLVVGLPSLRLRGDYLAIVTLGFNQIIISILQNADVVGGATGFNAIPRYADLVWIFALVIACVLCVRNLANSQLGRSMKAIRDDEIAAEAVGINTTGIKVLAFVVSAMWAGVAGALQVHYLGSANPDSFTFVKSVEIVVMVVLGGLGSITGSIVSASALKFLEEALREANSVFWVVAAFVWIGFKSHRVERVSGAPVGGLVAGRGGGSGRFGDVSVVRGSKPGLARSQQRRAALRDLRLDFDRHDAGAARRIAGPLGTLIAPPQTTPRGRRREIKGAQGDSPGVHRLRRAGSGKNSFE